MYVFVKNTFNRSQDREQQTLPVPNGRARHEGTARRVSTKAGSEPGSHGTEASA